MWQHRCQDPCCACLFCFAKVFVFFFFGGGGGGGVWVLRFILGVFSGFLRCLCGFGGSYRVCIGFFFKVLMMIMRMVLIVR